MAIEIRLDHMLLERKMTLTELAERVGITVPNLSILKTGKAKAVRLSTLDVATAQRNGFSCTTRAGAPTR